MKNRTVFINDVKLSHGIQYKIQMIVIWIHQYDK
jgi:hypothetical protein